MKRISFTFLMLCLIVVSLGLTGCGGGKQDAAPSAQTTPAPAAKQETGGDLFSKVKKMPDMSYDFAMIADDTNLKGKVWISGKKMKTEMTIENNKTISIVDGDAKVAYLYYPTEGTAMKTAYDEKAAQMVPTSKQFIDEMDASQVKVLETVTYEGVKCKVMLVKDKTSKAETKLWIWEEYGVALRIEAIDSDGGKMVMEHTNIKMGAPPAETFQLPAGVKVTDMAEMMKNLPKK